MVYVRSDEPESTLALEEYVSYVEDNVDTRDFASMCESASALRALANNRDFLLPFYHQELKDRVSTRGQQRFSPQSTLLHLGKTYLIRAVIWPAHKVRNGIVEVTPFTYDVPHNHNFHFCTVGYFGPGYSTDVYRCESVPRGEVGELVTLTEARTELLGPGKVMVYEAINDVHTQDAPNSLSISINLLTLDTEMDSWPQLIFDVGKGRIVGSAGNALGQRLYLVDLFRHLYDEETVDLLSLITLKHSCVRTQALALNVLRDIRPLEHERLQSRVPEAVRHFCQKRLAVGDEFFSSGFERAARDNLRHFASRPN